ncbi:hypothetical protein [Catenuloplanes japonicus]|uniref:hypothetical protein n=1 Tax=Catenuloplanes japonicus TaxID=33876 RepID=UPI000A959E8C|nr:hypothetical protein [Catenuloplanes japonicus]
MDSATEADTARTAALAAGAAPIAPPVTRPGGGRSAYIAGPEANRWEIAWPPVGARGALMPFG